MGMYNTTSDLNLPSFEYLLERAEQGADALIVTSGGLDSAYLLWKYSQVVTDRPIYLHHLDLYPSYYKGVHVENLVLQAQMQYLNRDFRLFHSTVDQHNNAQLLTDWMLAATLSVGIADQYGMSYIAVGDDLPGNYYRNLSYSKMDKRKRDRNIHLGAFIRATTEDRVDLVMGFDAPDLSELYNEMPEDYLKLVSSCRQPVVDGYFIRQCGECYSCYKNKNFGWFDRIGTNIKLEDLHGQYNLDTRRTGSYA